MEGLLRSPGRRGGSDGRRPLGSDEPAQGPRPETTARLMRRIHDGTGMGALWQTIIFLGGLIPALLAVTGILMWLHVRRGRLRGSAAT